MNLFIIVINVFFYFENVEIICSIIIFGFVVVFLSIGFGEVFFVLVLF